MSYKTTLVAALVAIIGLAVALLVGLAVTHNLNAETAPLVAVVIGLAGTAVPAILGLLKAEQVANKVDMVGEHLKAQDQAIAEIKTQNGGTQ